MKIILILLIMVQTFCPLKYGTVIYSVRNLYNAMTREINRFEDNCDGGSQNRSTGAPAQKTFIRLKEPIKQPITEPVISSRLSIFPNPAKDIVNISYPQLCQAIITDVTGKVVLHKQFNKTSNGQVNLKGLQKGILFIKVIGARGNISATQKLIVE